MSVVSGLRLPVRAGADEEIAGLADELEPLVTGDPEHAVYEEVVHG